MGNHFTSRQLEHGNRFASVCRCYIHFLQVHHAVTLVCEYRCQAHAGLCIPARQDICLTDEDSILSEGIQGYK